MAEDAPSWAGGTETEQPPSWASSTPQEKAEPGLLTPIAPEQRRQMAVTGAKRGLIGGLGTLGDVSSLMSRAFGVDPKLAEKFRGFPTSEEVGKKLEPVIGKAEGPSEKPIEFMANPLSWIGPGSGLSKLISAIGGGVGGEVGQKVAGTPGEVVGSVLGGGLAQKGAGKVVTPGKEIPINRQFAEHYLQNEGIDTVTAGQLKGSTPLRTAESQLGTAAFSGDVATERFNKQMRQFTRAASRRIGEDTEAITPEVVDQAFTRIGKEFDRLQSHSMVPDQTFTNEVMKARQDYLNLTSPMTRSEYLPDIANRLAMYGHQRQLISGELYKETRSTLDRIRRANPDPVVKDTVQDIINALDGAMERTLQKAGSKDVGAWREARRQYRNMLVIEKARPAGELGAEGIITPAKLRQAANSVNKRVFRRGKDDFSDLVTSGELLLSPVRTSKTAERAMIGAIPAELGGAGVAALMGNYPLAAALGTSAVGPGLAGRAIYSKPVQSYLKNQAASEYLKKLPPSSIASIRALLNTLGDRNAPQ